MQVSVHFQMVEVVWVSIHQSNREDPRQQMYIFFAQVILQKRELSNTSIFLKKSDRIEHLILWYLLIVA